MKKLVMSWSKAAIKIGPATSDGTMPAANDMFSMGVVNDKSTNLEASDGEELKATASGGVQVAYERGEGGYTLTTRIKEPSFQLFENFGLGEISASGDLEVKSHVVQGDWAVEVTPKNVGAIGIRVPYCLVTFKPGRSEEEGDFVDVTFAILPILNDDYEVEKWYTRFRKSSALVVTPKTLSYTAAADSTGKTVTATSEGNVTASSNQTWCTVTNAAKVATVKVSANTGATARTAEVTITADNKTAKVTVTQAGTSE